MSDEISFRAKIIFAQRVYDRINATIGRYAHIKHEKAGNRYELIVDGAVAVTAIGNDEMADRLYEWAKKE